MGLLTIESLIQNESFILSDEDPNILVSDAIYEAHSIMNELDASVNKFNIQQDTQNAIGKPEITTEGPLKMDHTGVITVDFKDPLDAMKRGIKDVLTRMWAAIQDFFKSVLNFFQSTVFRRDINILQKNFRYLQRYYTDNSAPSIKCNLTVYMSRDPFNVFINDSEILQRSIPAITNEIRILTEEIRNNHPNKSQERKYAYKEDEHSERIKSIQDEIFSKVIPSHLNPRLVTEDTIVGDIRSKYFGEKKEKLEQEIKDVITNLDSYSKLISQESFDVFKRMKDECDRSITTSLREINQFKDDVTAQKGGKDLYDMMRANVVSYKRLLSMLLRMSILYWELYYTFRTDSISAANAIINYYSHSPL